MPVRGYFSRPFPTTAGFSAYRMPGAAVHVPFFILVVAMGAALCRDSALMPAFLVIFAVVGLYVGRDVAILAHYNGLIALVVWSCFLILIIAPQQVSTWTRVVAHLSPFVPSMVTMAVLVVFVRHVVRWCGSR
jgi:hypothetical protein